MRRMRFAAIVFFTLATLLLWVLTIGAIAKGVHGLRQWSELAVSILLAGAMSVTAAGFWGRHARQRYLYNNPAVCERDMTPRSKYAMWARSRGARRAAKPLRRRQH